MESPYNAALEDVEPVSAGALIKEMIGAHGKSAADQRRSSPWGGAF